MEILGFAKYTFLLIVTLFYIPLAIMAIRLSKKKQARRQFFHALSSVLERVEDDSAVVDQVLIIFKKLSERYPHINSTHKNALGSVEDLFYRVEAYGEERFKSVYGIVFSAHQRARIVSVISIMKQRQPFSSISSKYGNLLNMIKHAFDTSNTTLGTSNLRQLADDIEVLEATLNIQAKRNQMSILVSVIGVVLTLVFGALTVIQLISRAVIR